MLTGTKLISWLFQRSPHSSHLGAEESILEPCPSPDSERWYLLHKGGSQHMLITTPASALSCSTNYEQTSALLELPGESFSSRGFTTSDSKPNPLLLAPFSALSRDYPWISVKPNADVNPMLDNHTSHLHCLAHPSFGLESSLQSVKLCFLSWDMVNSSLRGPNTLCHENGISVLWSFQSSLKFY